MNFSKIDAPLGAAISGDASNDDSQLEVFIHANRPLDHAEADELKELGVNLGSRPRRIITATVSRATVEMLTEKPWVRSIRLSQKLRPLDDNDSD